MTLAGRTLEVLLETAIRAALLGVVVLSLVGLLERAPASYWVTVAAAGAAVVLVASGLRHLPHWRPSVLLHLLGVVGAGAVVAFVVATGRPDPEPYGVLFAALIVTSGFVFETRDRLVLQSVGTVGYAVALIWAGLPSWWDLVLPLGLYLLLAHLAAGLSGGMRAAASADLAAKEQARLRAELVATAASLHTLDAERSLDTVCDAILRLGFAHASVGLLQPSDGMIELVASRGVGAGQLERVPPDRGLVGASVTRGETIVVDDYAASPYAIRDLGSGGSGGALATPVRAGGEVVGVIAATNGSRGAPEPWRVEVVERLAAQAGRALEHARRFADEQRAAQRLSELDGLKNDFMSNVSHELRTPLTVIQGLTHTLRVRSDRIPEEQQRDLLERVVANAERLEEMIGSLLDYSRFEEDGIRLSTEVFDLSALVSATAARLHPLLGDRPLTLDIGGSAPVEADRVLLEHVVENLLTNAAKHTPPGTPLHIEAVSGGGRVRVAVADEGPGIPAQELPRLTDRFYRGRAATDASKGLGLGLALVTQILEAHGSTLRISSEEGRGASFGFSLPLADRD